MNALASIQKHIDDTRRRYRLHRALVMFATGVGGTTVLLTVFLLLDNMIRTGVVVPRVFLAATCLILAGMIATIFWQWRKKISDDFTACLMERTLTDQDNRLINAVQLARDPHSRTVAETILDEKPPALQSLHQARLLPRPLVRNLTLFWASGLIGLLAVLIVMPERGAHSLSRLVSPLTMPAAYSRTRIVTTHPGDTTVLRGESVAVKTTVMGLIPARASIEWQRQNSTSHRTAMQVIDPHDQAESPVNRTFDGKLPPAYTTLRYRVLAGDTTSDWHTVEVLTPPAIQSWDAVVTPPSYTGIPPFTLSSENTTKPIPTGSRFALSMTTTTPVVRARVLIGTHFCLETTPSAPTTALEDSLDIPDRPGSFRVELFGENTMETTETLPLTLRRDRSPEITWRQKETALTAAADDILTLPFEAKDDYGLTAIQLTRVVMDNGATKNLIELEPDKISQERQSKGTFTLSIPTLNLMPGDEVILQARVLDNASPAQTGTSSLIRLEIVDDQQIQAEKQRAKQTFADALSALIERQRINYQNTSKLRDNAVAGQNVDPAATRNARNIQAAVLAGAHDVLRSEFKIGGLRNIILGLVENEMPRAIVIFDSVLAQMGTPDLKDGLIAETELQQRILAALSSVASSLDAELDHQRKVDVIQRLREMIEQQTVNLDATRNLDQSHPTTLLVKAQDALAQRYNAFIQAGRDIRETTDDDEFAQNLSAVMTLFEERKLYPTLIDAAEFLDDRDLTPATTSQTTALKTMKTGLNMLNAWSAENAVARLESARNMFERMTDALEKLEDDQTKILETTKELARRNEMDDAVRDELGRLDREQETMKDLIEELAQDLYQFPDMPVCNELNSMMNEIFEDVEQAMNSENEPAIEIAVQKEDAFLDAIRRTKERVEDIEMWMPDVPDNIVWNKESFDTDEFPDMPLVPLPDELDDIVGDLLDQAAEIDAQSQDTTGNNMMADGEMGWDIMDGPIPNFSAKGKSGNTRPNDNEMTGRSGAGREGQSSGELVEGVSKGLEGRETHARRTRDPFQSGVVEEEETSTLDAKATGGGKLGGVSETIGMFGKAPRRDQGGADHGEAASALRRETEALYTAARMLYLPTGSLGNAAQTMRISENPPPDMDNIDSLHRTVIRRLEESQAEIKDGVVVSMPSRTNETSSGETVGDIDLNTIDEKYRGMISDYYKNMDATND